MGRIILHIPTLWIKDYEMPISQIASQYLLTIYLHIKLELDLGKMVLAYEPSVLKILNLFEELHVQERKCQLEVAIFVSGSFEKSNMAMVELHAAMKEYAGSRGEGEVFNTVFLEARVRQPHPNRIVVSSSTGFMHRIQEALIKK